MRSSPVINFKVNEVARGFLKLSDGSTIIHRVAIVDVRTTEVGGPFNVNFEINIISGISVYPSSEVLEKIKNNPIITPGKKPPDDGWVPLDIVNKKNSIEEIIYTDKEIVRYYKVTLPDGNPATKHDQISKKDFLNWLYSQSKDVQKEVYKNLFKK